MFFKITSILKLKSETLFICYSSCTRITSCTRSSNSVSCNGLVMSSIVWMSSPGTLTQNEMVFRRLHLGTVAYGMDSMDEVQSLVFSAYTQVKEKKEEAVTEIHLIHWQSSFKFLNLGKEKNTAGHEYCFKKNKGLWFLFGLMLPDLRWHSLSPLTPGVSEAGNRISPQAKQWPDFLNDAAINPWRE